MQVCLRAMENRESRFLRGEGPVKLVQACLYAGTTWWRRFNLLGLAVKHVEACLSSRDDRESSFHRCGGRESLVQACLCARNPCKAVLTTEEMLWSTCRPVWVPGKIEKAFFSTVVSYEARASLFMCGKDLITPFSPPKRCCEAGAGLFKC